MQIHNGHLLFSSPRFENRVTRTSTGELTTIQLPDPKARSFTPSVLQKAMLETIAHINALLEEHGITEVSYAHMAQATPADA